MAKTVIVGGVAGGATAAARLRRLSESMEIILLERGDYISYANCGLPYYIGDVIRERDKLLVTPEALMRERFRIDVRTGHEALSIDQERRVLKVRGRDGRIYEESYDELLLATGSSPLRPPIPGIGTEGIYTLWTVEDTDRIRALVDHEKPRTAAVIGGGFIGLEMAENLHARGIHVSIVEAQDQVMAPLDFEMAQILHRNIMACGTALYLGDGVDRFEKARRGVKVTLKSGRSLTADMVLLSIGVRPNSQLAREAGLALGPRGGILVNERMETSAPHIWAAGDVVQVTNLVTGEPAMIPLAGPANKQGRIAACNIAAACDPAMDHVRDSYGGSLGTSVARVYDNTAGAVGVNEKTLKGMGKVRDRDYRALLIVQKSHAGYYPLAADLYIKVLFSMDGTILGAQIAGADGVDKRIDVIASVMRLGGKIRDLERLELAYAPPYSSAKDPVNMAGFVAGNMEKGLMRLRMPEEIRAMTESGRALVLDIREDLETALWQLPGSVHIPLGRLRDRIGELEIYKNGERELIIFCGGGVRAYNAERILRGHGFENVSTAAGGAGFYRIVMETSDRDNPAFLPSDLPEEEDASGRKGQGEEPEGAVIRLDCAGLQCPGPILKVHERLRDMKEGETLRVQATDMGFARDAEAWCRRTGHTFVGSGKEGPLYHVTIRKGTGSAPGREEEKAGEGFSVQDLPQGKTIVVFDGDFDKALAAFIIANGAAAMGRPVTMFFTFWGLNILRKTNRVRVKKSLIEKMFGAMMPRGTAKLALSKMNMLGMGTRMMKMIMRKKHVMTLEDLIQSALDNGVKIVACTMSMDVMGIKKEELIDGIDYAGVASYLGDAELSNVNLFI